MERDLLAGKIERRLKQGEFDIGRLPEQDRLPVARRYIELQEGLQGLNQHIKDLEQAAEFARRWVTQI